MNFQKSFYLIKSKKENEIKQKKIIEEQKQKDGFIILAFKWDVKLAKYALSILNVL